MRKKPVFVDKQAWIEAIRQGTKKKWSNGGPRKGHYDSVEARIEMARLMTLSMNRHLAEKAGKVYTSVKGSAPWRSASDLPYRNELQRKSFESLDSNPSVTSFRFLDDAIQTTRTKFKGNNRQYPAWMIVDLIVEYKNGSKKMIFLKPNGLDFREIKSFNDIERFCSQNGYDIEIWTADQFN
jgi:hypothetical protein